MKIKSCALQFTGGRDSTLTAITLIEKYEIKELHLLTFMTDLTADVNFVHENLNKLKKYFGEGINIIHNFVDTGELLCNLVQKNYLKNLLKYKTYNAATFCPSCRLSHHANTILYCLQNDIKFAADGVNELTGFDLFQQGWAVKKIQELYQDFQIDYLTPLLNNDISSEILLENYNKKNQLESPFYESQPKCLGGGQFHNLYLRCYFLPLKGKEKYKTISKQWIDDKLPQVKAYIINQSKD